MAAWENTPPGAAQAPAPGFLFGRLWVLEQLESEARFSFKVLSKATRLPAFLCQETP